MELPLLLTTQAPAKNTMAAVAAVVVAKTIEVAQAHETQMKSVDWLRRLIGVRYISGGPNEQMQPY